jgi:ParB family chromosome partitioning protein
LVCGEGRLKAFKSLGEADIPALVVEVSDEDAFIMSLAENIARRQYSPLELLAGIEQLRDRGYDKKAIAEKTGLTREYIQGVLTLLQKGEERLLVAVERGRIPLNTALDIVGAGNDDTAVQVALQDAYESGKLRGKRLLQARRVIERRQTLGRSVARGTPRKREAVTSSSLVRTYQKEVARQKLIVKKAEFANQRLLFVGGAMRELLADENFTNLLRAEGLDTLPKYLAERVWPAGVTA